MRRFRMTLTIPLLVSTCLVCANTSLKDPTQPPLAKISGYKLSMIVNVAGHDSAVINGKSVQVGESVDHAMVQSIGHEHVVLKTENGHLTLNLTPEIKS